MSATLYERCIALKDLTYELTQEAVDEDMVKHWSHYNGAANALCLIWWYGGVIPEAVVNEYESVVAEEDEDEED